MGASLRILTKAGGAGTLASRGRVADHSFGDLFVPNAIRHLADVGPLASAGSFNRLIVHEVPSCSLRLARVRIPQEGAEWRLTELCRQLAWSRALRDTSYAASRHRDSSRGLRTLNCPILFRGHPRSRAQASAPERAPCTGGQSRGGSWAVVGKTTRPALVVRTDSPFGGTVCALRSLHASHVKRHSPGRAVEWIAPRERLCAWFLGRQSPSRCRRRLFRGGAVASCSMCSSARPQTREPSFAAAACSSTGVFSRRDGHSRTTTLSHSSGGIVLARW